MNGTGLPMWVHSVVVLGLLGLLIYNVVKFGADGYPNSILIGGLLGGYAGLNEIIKRRNGDEK